VFTPTVDGPRVDGVDVGITLTVGVSAVVDALAAAAAADLGLLGQLLADFSDLLAPIVIGAATQGIEDAINPVVTLTGTGVILPPTISIDPAVRVVEGNDGRPFFTVGVHLDHAYPSAVAVDWHTVDGTAKAGSDYVATNGTLVIPGGTTEARIGLRVIGDTRLEDDETFSLVLDGPTGATVGTPGVCVVTILNDETPKVTLDGSSVPEGALAPIAITLGQRYYQPLTLTLTTTDGSATAAMGDYTPLTGLQVTVPAGSVGPVIVTVPTLADGVTEQAERFQVTAVGGLDAVSTTVEIRKNTT
jgi:Calx-beta domain